jgi:hypothetical protein
VPLAQPIAGQGRQDFARMPPSEDVGRNAPAVLSGQLQRPSLPSSTRAGEPPPMKPHDPPRCHAIDWTDALVPGSVQLIARTLAAHRWRR